MLILFKDIKDNLKISARKGSYKNRPSRYEKERNSIKETKKWGKYKNLVEGLKRKLDTAE